MYHRNARSPMRCILGALAFALFTGAAAEAQAIDELLSRAVAAAEDDFASIEGRLQTKSTDLEDVYDASLRRPDFTCMVRRPRRKDRPAQLQCTGLRAILHGTSAEQRYQDFRTGVLRWAGNAWQPTESKSAWGGDTIRYLTLRQNPPGLIIELQVMSMSPSASTVSLFLTQRPGVASARRNPASEQDRQRSLEEQRRAERSAWDLLWGPTDETACNGGEGEACRKVGVKAHEAGDAVRAESWLRKGCIARDPVSCSLLGEVLFVGGEGLPRNLFEAARAFATGCDIGEPGGCLKLGQVFEAGLGVPQSAAEAARAYAEAIRLYRRDIAAGHAYAYLHLGWMAEHGKGAAADLNSARSLYRSACDAGFNDGCTAAERLK